ncbi:hypothetical protein [Salirhabdus salicampi]|uniref:hypothetical protein n=1 Tax=Salirhabdus salicampi TaxID=476102 RepID=UPI0020C216A3|nr:hypothetical protein [Salirhabdus salicampi]MCP8617774.1 hypothetical protein [Salirhabdus salicampi]
MMDFLYFPQDKTEYIPSIFMLVLFTIAAILVMRIIIKASKREEEQFKKRYEHKIGKMNNDDHPPTS